MASYELLLDKQLDNPALVVCLEGWIDAGGGAAAAMASLLHSMPNDVLAVFDADEFIDHRARRPIMTIVDGVNTGLRWPQIELRAAQDRTGNDLLLLTGPEPDMRWHHFVDTVVGLTVQMGVRLEVGFGAFPAPVPHTRPVRLAATATTAELAEMVGFVGGDIQVPSSIGGALENGFEAAGIPAVGLWARVPHYAAAMPFPAASVALLEGLQRVAGIAVDTRELLTTSALTAARIDQLIAASDEHTEMVRQLEAGIDATETPLQVGDLPSGDELAAELERFLRDNPPPRD